MRSLVLMKKGPSHSRLILILLLVLSVWIGVSGCLDPFPAAEQLPPTEKPGEETLQNGASLPSAPVTMEPETTVVESPSGYIARSFGLVPFETPPNFRINYIDSVAVRDGTGGIAIQGRLKNEGPEDLKYLHVTFHLFDSGGSVLGNVDATIEYLPAGMTWHYTTSSYRTEFYQYYQIAGIVAQ